MKRVTQTLKEFPAQLTYVAQTTHTCDWCSKQVSDNSEFIIGGSHNGGWYHVERTPKSTGLDELRKPREWDFCSFECLSCWVNDRVTVVNQDF